MLKLIIRLLKGYMYVALIGKSPERFVNLCRYHNIYIWDVHIYDGIYYFNIYIEEYKRLIPIVKKTRTYPHIIKRIGLPFLLAALIKKRTLLPALMVFCAVLYILSLFVWNVTISGECRHTEEELMEFLDEKDFHAGMLRSMVNGNEIEKMIRNKYEDISWVSVELSGCNVYIKILESDIMNNMTNDDNTCSDIIASSDGIVSSIITRKGTPKVVVGDEVKKGDVLVSGIVSLLDDGGNIIENKKVYADADIIIDTSYSYKDIFPLIHEVKQYTGRDKTEYVIKCNNRFIFIENILNKLDSFEKYDIINQYVDNSLCEKLSLDILAIKMIYKEYEIVNESYNNQEASDIASLHLNRYINALDKSGVSVYDNRVILNVKDGMCIADGVLYVKEPQLLRQDVEEGSVNASDGNDGTDD